MARSAMGRSGDSHYMRIYAAVRRIPRGRVATYGLVARVAGLAGHARQVGYALHALRGDDHNGVNRASESSRAGGAKTGPERGGESARAVPWQRVINARGEISLRAEGGADLLQRALLEQEGIVFDAAGRVDLARFLWRPRGGIRPSSAGSQVARRVDKASDAAPKPRRRG